MSSIPNENTEKFFPISVVNNEFGLKLLKDIAKNQNQNFSISPLSISTGFGMLYSGAVGKTAKEICDVIGYEFAQLSEQMVDEQLKNILKLFDDKKYNLYIANRVLISKNFEIQKSYQNTVLANYNVSVHLADFSNQTEEETNYINEWVKIQTHDMIEKVFDQPLDKDTKLVLINTIYFKGKWKYTFDRIDTISQKFFGYDSEYDTNFMIQEQYHNYTYSRTLKSQLLELPYDGNHLSMIIVLPTNRNGLKSLKEKLDHFLLEQELLSMKLSYVKVLLPKFKLSTSYDLIEILKSLGIKKLFGVSANLSKMTASNGIYVDKVTHRAVIEVNEEGSEAAAVTAVVGRTKGSCYLHSFCANHPFAFFIRHNNTGIILFSGHVVQV